MQHPLVWYTLHLICYISEHTSAYRKKDIKIFIHRFIDQLVANKIINPKIQIFVEQNHIDFKTSLFQWSIDCHNHVNEADGLPQMSKDDVTDFYYNLSQISNPQWIIE